MPAPDVETGDITVAAPPLVPPAGQSKPMIRLLPVVMAGATAALMAMFFFTRSGAARNPMFMAFPLMMVISAVVTAITGRDRTRMDIDCDRADYLDYLGDLRRTVTKTAAAQRASLDWRHPHPDSLWALVGSARMWERRPTDADYCEVRIGTGTQQLATGLSPPQLEPAHTSDPVTMTALLRFLRTHSTVADVPVAIALQSHATVTIAGDQASARGLVRAMICQLAVLHSPARLLIAGAIGDGNRPHWDWLKWLPHNHHPHARDDSGPVRMVYPTVAAVEKSLDGLLSQDTLAPQLVVVVDGAVLEVRTGYGAPAAQLEVADNTLCLDGGMLGCPDRMDLAAATVCARRLAAYHADHSAECSPAGSARWQDLLGIDDVAGFSPQPFWDSQPPAHRLSIPIGTADTGATVDLDIKEAAHNGMGPHGLCVGATGSGKSELLRCIALGMIARHSPEVLNMVLVDFKGGATFLDLQSAPHVAAVITNLSDDAPLVARMRDALTGEVTRRQELLRTAGNVESIDAYRRARRANAELPPLPALFIVVDEFSELLSQQPDFADVFVSIGRLGRSLGMHLLLASQRLDEGRLRGLDSHLSYRICLKTLSANESRIVLGTSDAYDLAGTPGAGYLRTAPGELTRFQSAYVSGPCPRKFQPAAPAFTAPHATRRAVRRFTAAPTGPITVCRAANVVTDERTVLQTLADRVSGHGPPAHEVWLPPLGEAPALDALLHDVAARDLFVPIGIVDRPFEQRRTPLTVELSGAAGNVAVIGSPQSGKSTVLRTLITALAATHDPSMVQFYCLDFGGGALTSVRSLPHVGSVAGRAEPELGARMVVEMESLVRSREALFRGHGIESISQYRRLKARRDPVCDRFGDVFLVIDGWTALRHDFETLELSISTLAAQGLSFGVHVVVAASRWAELRPALRDQIGTRIELRLSDPTDSELDRRRAQQVPEGKPGRGLSRDGLHMVIALPRLDGVTSADGLAEASVQAAELVRRRYPGEFAPPIPLLPACVDRHDVVSSAGDELQAAILLGLEERRLLPAVIDFDRYPHLLILGDGGCGKTATLRTLCREIARTATAAHAQLFIVDFRRTLLGVIESEHLGGYAMSRAALDALLPELLGLLQSRLPPPHVTQAQLRARSWWSGPNTYVVVDDYELVATDAGNPLTPILEYLPHAGDVGLRVVVARRSGGAARAMFDPLLVGLRDFGCTTLMMSAQPDEGPLIGSLRPMLLPPGRGTLITRAGRDLVQVAWSPPP
ncbi:type VII secretion protein EccC [Mycobacterium kyorinense]|uniref:Type VII secretion protein EccC n=1 Tax=Mycobacterium kyorinense TaxID=487514 RepID=A0A1A2ZHM8_9MYCO|nr:type VII secretion protein EccC [Mycobacterium kyorinense]